MQRLERVRSRNGSAHCPGSEVYFFIDGDASVVPGSFSAMMRALKPSSRARGLGGAGRGPQHGADRRDILENQGGANLYSLRGSYVERLRQLSVRIPVGSKATTA